MKKITVYTGHFGSGKTEIAINHALKLARNHEKVTIVDLDIVNPFFRTAEHKEMLNGEGVHVITPVFAATTVDVPSLPAEIFSVFQNKERKVIFDVGGDELGAVALGRYTPYFKKAAYEMIYVINTKRPLSSTPEEIIEMLKAVEGRSRLEVTELINNTNLSYETSIYDIMEGQTIVEQTAKQLGIPIRGIAGTKEILDKLPEEYCQNQIPLEIYMKPPWE